MNIGRILRNKARVQADQTSVTDIRKYQRALDECFTDAECVDQGVPLEMAPWARIVYAGFSLDGWTVDVGTCVEPMACLGGFTIPTRRRMSGGEKGAVLRTVAAFRIQDPLERVDTLVARALENLDIRHSMSEFRELAERALGPNRTA